MVSAYPNLRRRFINTDGIVNVGKSHLLPDLLSKHPEDYIDINTHKVMERVKPWAEIPSPIAREAFGIMDGVIPPAIQERWERQRRYGFTHDPAILQPIVIDKILVLLVDFPDKPAQVPIETVYQRFFGDYVNSLKEYYREVSYGRYIPRGELHGWYRAPNPSIYYTNKENGFGKYPNSAEKLVEDVVEIARTDPDIDWSSFDNNDNGYIDNLIVVHSGAEAAWTGDVNDFWAHVWIIPEPKMIKGRYVWIYAMTSEYLGNPEGPLDSPINQVIGGDCHEHGHQLGLPDLYDYTDQSNGVGAYSLMGAGSWGNKGQTPIHLDPWSKYVLGFTDPIIEPMGTVYIDNAEQNSINIIYTTADPKEYFMVENRQKVLYDKYLPSEGLFVWRINENQIDNQMYNNDKSCYLVGLEQADNLKDLENRANLGDLGDPFPGIMNNRSFGRFTNPSSMLCEGQIQDFLIGNISDSGTTMSFESLIPGPSAPSQIESGQECAASIDADTLTALVGETVMLTAIVEPPGIYDINFRVDGELINPDPITTNPDGTATLPVDTTDQTPGLYNLTVEVISPISCASSPLTVALTTTRCGEIMVNIPSPITTYIGDMVNVPVVATVTEPSVVEFRDTTYGTRIGSCIIDPAIGSCTANIDTTESPPGTYNVVATIGYGDFQQCMSEPIEAILLPPEVEVCFRSNPSGASIYIDDVLQDGKTTVLSETMPIDGVEECTSESTVIVSNRTGHTYRITLEGYQPIEYRVDSFFDVFAIVDVGDLTPIQCEMVSMSLTSVEPITVGGSRTLRADVSPAEIYPVMFYDGTDLLGETKSDSSGTAIFTWTTTPTTTIGTHHITANAISPTPCTSPEIVIDVIQVAQAGLGGVLALGLAVGAVYSVMIKLK